LEKVVLKFLDLIVFCLLDTVISVIMMEVCPNFTGIYWR